MEDKIDLKKKLKEGWIHCRMNIEVLAISHDAAKTSLEAHVAQMEKENRTIFYKKQFHEIRKIENPHPNIKEGYSNLVTIELLAKDFDTLVYLTMNYGPSSIEILSPEKITLPAGEAQGILNSIADLIHKFAQQGIGGIVIRS